MNFIAFDYDAWWRDRQRHSLANRRHGDAGCCARRESACPFSMGRYRCWDRCGCAVHDQDPGDEHREVTPCR